MGKKRYLDCNMGDIFQRILLYIYLIGIFGVYPVITTNKYFNITITKYSFFIWSSIAYSVLVMLVYLWENIGKTMSEEMTSVCDRGSFYQRPEFWMEAFLLANVFSFIVSIDKRTSLMGAGVRYMGMVTYIVIAVTFLIIAAAKAPVGEWIFMIFAPAVFYGEIVAVLQHMGIDFMKYREGISPKLYNIYISTFGNINLYASFLAMCIPVFAVVYIFGNKTIYKITSAIILSVGGNCLMAANSDTGFLGVAAAYCMILLLAVSNKKLINYIISVALVFGGIFLQALLNRFVLDYHNKRGGVAGLLDNLFLTGIIFFSILIIMLTAIIVKKHLGDRFSKTNTVKISQYMAVLMSLFVGATLLVGRLSGLAAFNIDYKWGTYRGMIWHISAEIFSGASGVHKLFGFGNETLGILARSDYYDVMMENTKKVYDNAHNEPLQYLVTLGLVGLAAYIGLFVCCFAYILKNSEGNMVAYACLGAMTGYFSQALFNVNQPITTPFLFIFMAVGINTVRNCNKGGNAV